MLALSRLPRLCLLLLGFLLLSGLLARFRKRLTLQPRHPPAETAVSAVLQRPPFVAARVDEPCPGVVHWTTDARPDTTLDLIRFDFSTNPRLRVELFDQDARDRTPFDNEVHFWRLGVARVARLLARDGRGPIVAAWNGSFFSSRQDGGELVARHIAPVVLNGVAHYPQVNHRWTMGVRYKNGKPVFRVVHLPGREALERLFTFAAGGVQCLVRDGEPLRLPRPPAPGAAPLSRPVPSTPAEVGAIPGNDFVRASRTSLGWTAAPLRLYVLIVKAHRPHHHGQKRAEDHVRSRQGGWTLEELQQFWQSLHATGAVNLDGGDMTQMICRRSDGRWDLVPPRAVTPAARLVLPPNLRAAPGGGSVMYFYVRLADRPPSSRQE